MSTYLFMYNLVYNCIYPIYNAKAKENANLLIHVLLIVLVQQLSKKTKQKLKCLRKSSRYYNVDCRMDDIL